MTAGPVNLNRFRKHKVRAEKRARANENVARFGRGKAEKARDTAKTAGDDRRLDHHKRDP